METEYLFYGTVILVPTKNENNQYAGIWLDYRTAGELRVLGLDADAVNRIGEGPFDGTLLAQLLPDGTVDGDIEMFDDEGNRLRLKVSFVELPQCAPTSCVLCGETMHPYYLLAHIDSHDPGSILLQCMSFYAFYKLMHREFAELMERLGGDSEVRSDQLRFGLTLLEKYERRWEAGAQALQIAFFDTDQKGCPGFEMADDEEAA